MRAESLSGESQDDVIQSRDDDNPSNSKLLTTSPIIDPDDLIGRTFVMNTQPDGQQFRARIVKLIEDHDYKLENNKDRIKFLLSVNEDTSEEVITYNQLLDYLAKEDNNDIVWKFKSIILHQGPVSPTHPDYKGSMFNVIVEWENGETTAEPLQIIAKDDPVTCAVYAKENGLLNTPGWKQFKSITKRQKKFTRMVNQAKLRSYNTAPKFKNGYQVPRNYSEAVRLDERNGNNKWQEAINLELQQINDYDTFVDCGHHTSARIPSEYKKIRVHFVFDVKHDGRHKARLVADGHLTEVPLESVYSGVVSLRGFRLVLFLAELNNLELWATDIGNAYLEAYTSEKVYIIAGPEFGELEGHALSISKALYGLRSRGARWHDRFADCITELGFFPCKSEPDIWMRKSENIYEYVAVYVDDLAIAMIKPKEFVDVLEEKHKFKTKGTGPITFHLGMDFSRDDDNTLCLSSSQYIEKLLKNYERMFGQQPKQNVSSPLEKGDHPETDTSEFLDTKGIQMYQSMI
jgi:Reverse transcriptase (RNA-dependent DNA polymerase)